MDRYEKTGYLHQEFKMFHLTDRGRQNYAFHYHDFHKLLIFIRGNVTYHVEGKSYVLQPYDLVFVRAGEVHRPVVDTSMDYERIIIYISPEYAAAHSQEIDLSHCFRLAAREKSNVLRMGTVPGNRILSVMQELHHTYMQDGYADDLYRNTLFLELMILLNRSALQDSLPFLEDSHANGKILSVLSYINEHLTEELSIEALCAHFFLSRSYLMHSFRNETGYTIGNYITTKRLLYARELILAGASITESCFSCGFRNYSTFSRAYKKQFGTPPRTLRS